MIIALLGVDGSGKTTLSKGLVRKLRQKGKKAKYFYLGDYFILSNVVRFLHFVYSHFERRSKRAKRGQDENPFLGESKKHPLLRIWVILTALDNFLNFFRLSFYSFLGYLVICDRYFYDKLIGFEYHGYSTKTLSWLYLKMTPRPDLLLILDVKEEISKKREVGGRHSLGFYRKLRNKYRQLAFCLGVGLIDNSKKTKNETLEELLVKI
jgi:hypothetical protein